MMSRRAPLVFPATAVVSALCISSLAMAGPLHTPDPLVDPAIYGGEATALCAWPTTVFLGGCTGTLVHPEVIIYAAHCGANQNTVRFGESGDAATKIVGTKFCRTNPAYSSGQGGTDQAFCVLDQPVDDVPIVPILMGCETSVLTPGAEVVIVGFGDADGGPGYGQKREAWTTLQGVSSSDEALIGGGGIDPCSGDSGGPAYIRLSSELGGDDSWRVFGIVSYGPIPCGGGSYYSMMHPAMEWFESELAAEGIDLTPCHDADGTWNPTPQCASFPLDHHQSIGNWSEGCGVGGELGPSSSICGDPFDAEPDEDSPTVTITSPTTGSTYETMGAETYTLVVEADAQDLGWGVKELRLLIDGAQIAGGTDITPPYQWQLGFPPGGYVLEALAIDHAEHETLSLAVVIGIDQDPPPMPPPPSNDDEGDGEGDAEDGTADEGEAQGELGTGESDTGQNDDGGKGCACSASQGTPRGSGTLGLLALLHWRRRR